MSFASATEAGVVLRMSGFEFIRDRSGRKFHNLLMFAHDPIADIRLLLYCNVLLR